VIWNGRLYVSEVDYKRYGIGKCAQILWTKLRYLLENLEATNISSDDIYFICCLATYPVLFDFLPTNNKINYKFKFDYCVEETCPNLKFFSVLLRETVTSESIYTPRKHYD